MKYNFVLNTHIPQSDRPWAYEALFHCYLPLFEEIKNFPVTMCFSPQLIYEFTEKDFKKKARSFFENSLIKAKKIKNNVLKKHYIDFYENQFSKLKECGFNLSDLWKSNKWEIASYPSTHCVMPLLTDKVMRFFIDEGEKVSRDFWGVQTFSGIWMPEMGFEDGLNNQLAILAEKYKYILGNWYTIKGAGAQNRLYEDKSGLKVIIRNDMSQQAFWGKNCRIAGFPDYRECHRMDEYGNKINRIGGGAYNPDDAEAYIKKSYEIMYYSLLNELGDYCSIMFDTEYLGHYFWEGVKVFKMILTNIEKDLVTCSDIISSSDIKPRPIDLSGMSYTWGSMGDERSNSTLESWVNGKTHKYLQYYREALIKIDKYSKNDMKAKAEYLRQFFSSDWLFMVTFNHNDINDRQFIPSEYAKQKLLENFYKL